MLTPVANSGSVVFVTLRPEILYLSLWRSLLSAQQTWEQIIKTLETVINNAIAERRTGSVEREDLLGILLSARDETGKAADILAPLHSRSSCNALSMRGSREENKTREPNSQSTGKHCFMPGHQCFPLRLDCITVPTVELNSCCSNRLP